MPIWIQNFRGAIPRLNPRTLDPSIAQTAENCTFERGDLRPINGLTLENDSLDTSVVKTIFKNNDVWLTFDEDTDVVRAPMDNAKDRYFYTNATDGPKKNDDDGTAYDLGVDPDTTALTITLDPASSDNDVIRTVSYVYTRVTSWGEESAPSRPTAVTDIKDGQTVQLSGFSTGSQSNVSHYRVYRLNYGETGADYFIVPYQATTAGTIDYEDDGSIKYDVPVADVDEAGETFDDLLSGDYLGEAIQTEGWDAPPSDLMGLTYCGYGFCSGYSGNTVYFNEPWYFYAWPSDYNTPMLSDVVAIAALPGQVFVFTEDGTISVMEGITPGSMSKTDLQDKQTCQSKQGVVATKYGVIFPGDEGLCLATSSGVNLISGGFWTKEQWDALTPSNLIGVLWEGRYYGFFEGDATGFYISLDEDQYTLVTFDLGNYTIHDAFVNHADGKLYLSIDTGDLYSFDTDTDNPLSMTWKSKEFHGKPRNYAAMRVIAESEVTVSVDADDTQKSSSTYSSDEYTRLPGGFLAHDYEVTITGTGTVNAVGLGMSIQELANG